MRDGADEPWRRDIDIIVDHSTDLVDKMGRAGGEGNGVKMDEAWFAHIPEPSSPCPDSHSFKAVHRHSLDHRFPSLSWRPKDLRSKECTCTSLQ